MVIWFTQNSRNKLKEKNFVKGRNKFGGHKDIDAAGDTTLLYSFFISDANLSFSKELLNEMNMLMKKYFDVDVNNLFESLHQKGFQRMYELFEEELRMNKMRNK